MISKIRRGEFIQVYSGRQFWPMDPRSNEISIVDIAHSLSMMCRFAGHCCNFYSVAEHSVHVARACSPGNRLWGLLHDASEAYLVDVPRPVKPFLGGYAEAERRLQINIARRFGLFDTIPAEVHEMDTRILIDERRQNMAPGDYEGGWPDGEPLGVKIECWPPERAKYEFLAAFADMRCTAEHGSVQ